jgi:hypothetical protein
MPRNRKHQSASVRFGPWLKAFLLCLFFGGSGLGYVWQKNQLLELGRRIRLGELRLEELQRQNKLRADALSHLRSPRYLDQRVTELKLGLGLPQPEQIVRLIELPPDAPPVRPSSALLVGRWGGGDSGSRDSR